MPLPDRAEDEPLGSSSPAGRSLGEALAWLDRHVNLEAIERGVAGRAADPTLERIAALVSALGDPQLAVPMVHITGTNGKGSTTRLLAALLGADGLCVGTYTSPHLGRVNERIARAGEPITDQELAENLMALRDLEGFLNLPGSLPPTWFEVITAAAFRYFADVAVDAAVVEVGLGGRYDATNVIQASVAGVTNVELDHTEILGPTRESIAAEKAGIIKAGSIAVIGEPDPAIVDIFVEEARHVGVEALWRRGSDFGVAENAVAVGGRLVNLWTPSARYEDVFLALHGGHQAENASLALAAAEAFFGAPLDETVVREAFTSITVPGRLEIIGRRPLVVLDGAHNAAGAATLGAALAEDFAALQRIVVVMGCLRGRDPAVLLDALGSDRISWVVACAPGSPRALPAEAVLEGAQRLGLDGERADGIDEAVERGLEVAAPDDLVLVTGSLYVVGGARSTLRRLQSRRP